MNDTRTPARTPASAPAGGRGEAVPRGPGRALAGWVVAVVALAVAAVVTVLWLDRSAADEERSAIAGTAGQLITTLTNWDADDLAGVRDDVDALATDRFRDEARALLDDIGQGLAQAGAHSRGEVLDLAAESLGEVDGAPTGTALGVVRQEITNVELPQPDVACWGARATVKQVNGRWLVDSLELYGPNACSEGVASEARGGGDDG